MATPGDQYVFTGLDVHLKRARRKAGAMTKCGLFVIVVSLGIQGLVLWAQSNAI